MARHLCAAFLGAACTAGCGSEDFVLPLDTAALDTAAPEGPAILGTADTTGALRPRVAIFGNTGPDYAFDTAFADIALGEEESFRFDLPDVVDAAWLAAPQNSGQLSAVFMLGIYDDRDDDGRFGPADRPLGAHDQMLVSAVAASGTPLGWAWMDLDWSTMGWGEPVSFVGAQSVRVPANLAPTGVPLQVRAGAEMQSVRIAFECRGNYNITAQDPLLAGVDLDMARAEAGDAVPVTLPDPQAGHIQPDAGGRPFAAARYVGIAWRDRDSDGLRESGETLAASDHAAPPMGVVWLAPTTFGGIRHIREMEMRPGWNLVDLTNEGQGLVYPMPWETGLTLAP